MFFFHGRTVGFSKSVPLTWLCSKGRDRPQYGRPIFAASKPFWEAEKCWFEGAQQNPAIFGEGLISKMTSLDMIFGIILEGKYEYSSIYDLEIQPKWINFQESEGFSMSLLSIPSLTWKEIYSLSCNPPSSSDYRKSRCGMFLKVDLSKKIAVWLHIGSTYDSVLIRNLKIVFYNYKKNYPPPPKKRFCAKRYIIYMWVFASILNHFIKPLPRSTMASFLGSGTPGDLVG